MWVVLVNAITMKDVGEEGTFVEKLYSGVTTVEVLVSFIVVVLSVVIMVLLWGYECHSKKVFDDYVQNLVIILCVRWAFSFALTFLKLCFHYQSVCRPSLASFGGYSQLSQEDKYVSDTLSDEDDDFDNRHGIVGTEI